MNLPGAAATSSSAYHGAVISQGFDRYRKEIMENDAVPGAACGGIDASIGRLALAGKLDLSRDDGVTIDLNPDVTRRMRRGLPFPPRSAARLMCGGDAVVAAPQPDGAVPLQSPARTLSAL